MSLMTVLMLVGDFVEDYEAMVPYQMLELVGHTVRGACPGKKAGDHVVTAIHDFDGYQTYSEKAGHRFIIDVCFEETNVEEYDAIMIPGGRAPEYLQLNSTVLEVVRRFEQAEKPIAALCHGVQVLVASGVVRGKRCTGYPSMRHEVTFAGGQWCEPCERLSTVCVDRNLVTGAAWPAIPEWMRGFLTLLGTRITS